MGLQVVENSLVTIYQNHAEEMLVNARELHGFLNNGYRFSHWITDRIEKYGFVEGEDFFKEICKSTGGRPAVEYLLKLDVAKEIAMAEANERGRKVRRYFIEAEKRYRQLTRQQPACLEDLIIMNAQALKDMRLEQERQRTLLEAQNARLEQQENKVTTITTYLTETPERAKVERKVREYARLKHNRDVHAAWREIYSILRDKQGFDVMQRVENERKRLNEERAASGQKRYAEATLRKMVNGMDILERNGMLSDVLEIVAGLAGR